MTDTSKSFHITISKKSLNKFLSNIIPVKTAIPDFCIINSKLDPNKVADWMEQQVESAINAVGLVYNHSSGPDIEQFDIEFKTRMKESTSYHSVGATNLRDIFSNDWHESRLKRKVQLQYRVTYSNIHMNVVESRLYNFTDKKTQEALENAYMTAKKDLVKIFNAGGLQKGVTFVRAPDQIAHFQLKSGTYDANNNMLSGSFQFRIGHSYMEKMLNRALTDPQIWGNSGLFSMST